MTCTIKAERGKQKKYYLHRFIWECYNGIIPPGLKIDHKNDIRDDNRLCNLQLVTPSENCKKAAKNRNFCFVENKRAVVAINLSTRERHYFPSFYRAGKELGINRARVHGVCEGLRRRTRSNFDNYWYRFEYLDCIINYFRE